jgi:hypothetical protein
VIERIIRMASSFEEAAEIDRQDVESMSIEERISGVERLRRVWFIEDRAESRLSRVLVSADLPTRPVPLYVIGRDALLKNKRASGRDKDLRDVALLEEHAPTPKEKGKKPIKSRRRAT